MSKTYVRIGKTWHSGEETGEPSQWPGRAGFQLDCNGAVIPVGHPSSTTRPRELCPGCVTGRGPAIALALKRRIGK